MELVKGECSDPPLHDDVIDYYLSDFYNYDIDDDYYDVNSDHHSHIRPKWDEKTIQVAGDLAGDPLDSRNTRSQFISSLSTCELNISEILFAMVGYYPYRY